MKEALLSTFLKGKTKEELEKQGRKFSENYLPKVLRKKALKKMYINADNNFIVGACFILRLSNFS